MVLKKCMYGIYIYVVWMCRTPLSGLTLPLLGGVGVLRSEASLVD